MEVSFVLVSWNVCELVRRSLTSILAESAGIQAEIILVDNASRDGTGQMVQAEFPSVHLIANPDNRGFTAGNNQALALAEGRYLFLLNPDTELLPGATKALVDFLESNPQVGIAAPQLLNPNGTIQSSRRRFPTFATALLESTRLQRWFPHNPWLSRYYVLDKPDDEPQEVDWVVGAAMLARREVYQQVGGLDEGYFMYSEELDWCYRAKLAGWRVVYFPGARVVHHLGKSSEQVAAARDIYFHSSKIRFFRKFHGRLLSECLRLFLLLMFGYQLLEESAKWLIGHKRPLRSQRIRAYRQVLRSGLR